MDATPRPCTRCGAAIAGRAAGQARYCSPRCRAFAQEEVRWLRTLAAQEGRGRVGGRYSRHCELCRGWFTTSRADARFCHPACRQAAARRRRAFRVWLQTEPDLLARLAGNPARLARLLDRPPRPYPEPGWSTDWYYAFVHGWD